MHTIIRDARTPKNDFVFFADRLSRLVVEAGLGHLPFRDKSVITPTGVQPVVALPASACLRAYASAAVLLQQPLAGIDLTHAITGLSSHDSDLEQAGFPRP
jgi:uracil phosphoribosyltransferase